MKRLKIVVVIGLMALCTSCIDDNDLMDTTATDVQDEVETSDVKKPKRRVVKTPPHAVVFGEEGF